MVSAAVPMAVAVSNICPTRGSTGNGHGIDERGVANEGVDGIDESASPCWDGLPRCIDRVVAKFVEEVVVVADRSTVRANVDRLRVVEHEGRRALTFWTGAVPVVDGNHAQHDRSIAGGILLESGCPTCCQTGRAVSITHRGEGDECDCVGRSEQAKHDCVLCERGCRRASRTFTKACGKRLRTRGIEDKHGVPNASFATKCISRSISNWHRDLSRVRTSRR